MTKLEAALSLQVTIALISLGSWLGWITYTFHKAIIPLEIPKPSTCEGREGRAVIVIDRRTNLTVTYCNDGTAHVQKTN